ncbi:competence protein ComK [Pseudoneobacillus rhizosphaerae]|uniref:Competence transcription factor n=1 Tax=Pseudoneobacillus rhizosphaerae TaxID=2880968 RepID=A0A9C7GBW5_9BACI|nr:competence protein ComK [Pseudoneobacillus rhizosphaerae]CAG9609247.1 Competence transcription factor [Pseudoneobacillus rhizosphaerae]
MNDRMIEEYIINQCTLLIMPEYYGSKIYSRIYELEDDFIVPFKPLDIVKASCQFYCSSYKGRIEGSHNVIGKIHKAPISIYPTLFFFPTTSPNRQDCTWVNDQHVLNYRKATSESTFATFSNKETYEIPVSARSFANQLLRTAHLRNKFMQRINDMERRKSQLYYYSPTKMSASENKDEYGKLGNRKTTHLQNES